MYQTLYGKCMTDNPQQFIPDLELNSSEELLSWRNAIKAIEQAFYAWKLPFRKCITWTTDGFFRETRDMVTYRKMEGCSTVEMECAALAACARKRGAVFGQILYTADSLANVYAHDERDWGKGSLRKALELCINVLITM